MVQYLFKKESLLLLGFSFSPLQNGLNYGQFKGNVMSRERKKFRI